MYMAGAESTPGANYRELARADICSVTSRISAANQAPPSIAVLLLSTPGSSSGQTTPPAPSSSKKPKKKRTIPHNEATWPCFVCKFVHGELNDPKADEDWICCDQCFGLMHYWCGIEEKCPECFNKYVAEYN